MGIPSVLVTKKITDSKWLIDVNGVELLAAIFKDLSNNKEVYEKNSSFRTLNRIFNKK